jgi:hypothetical protein
MSPGNLPSGMSFARGHNNPTNSIKMPITISAFCITKLLVNYNLAWFAIFIYGGVIGALK